jgi:hypothetical protein
MQILALCDTHSILFPRFIPANSVSTDTHAGSTAGEVPLTTSTDIQWPVPLDTDLLADLNKIHDSVAAEPARNSTTSAAAAGVNAPTGSMKGSAVPARAAPAAGSAPAAGAPSATAAPLIPAKTAEAAPDAPAVSSSQSAEEAPGAPVHDEDDNNDDDDDADEDDNADDDEDDDDQYYEDEGDYEGDYDDDTAASRDSNGTAHANYGPAQGCIPPSKCEHIKCLD